MNYYLLLFLLCLSACSSGIEELKFPYTKGYEAHYLSTSSFYKEDGSLRFKQSDTIVYKIHRDLSENSTRSHEWLLLPGILQKEIPDTILTIMDNSGLYTYYGPEILPEGAKQIKSIALPLKEGKTWKSDVLSFPAKATYVKKDSNLVTPAGEFEAFAIRYEFIPFYMEEFIKDKDHQEVRGELTDYYSQDAGKVFSQMDYYVVERASGKKLWRIISNRSILIQLKIPQN